MAGTVSIKVLGSGCPNCKMVEAAARRIVSELQVEANIEAVHDYKQIMAYGVMSTPALVINEVVKAAGRIPAKAEITGWVKEALA